MRLLFGTILVLVLATPARAVLVLYGIHAEGPLASVPPSALFQLRHETEAFPPFQLTIPTPPLADTKSIGPDNAALFGITDWAAFSHAPNDPNWRRMTITYGTLTGSGKIGIGGTVIGGDQRPDDTLTSYTITGIQYQRYPLQSGGEGFNVLLFGDGTFIPEPASCLLVAIEAISLSHRRRVLAG